MVTRKDEAAAFLRMQCDLVRLLFCTRAGGLLLVETVADGLVKWRQGFVREYAGAASLADLDVLANRLFAFFERVYKTRYGDLPPAVVLASVDGVSLPTAREIDDAWEIDEASSEEGRRYFHGDLTKDEVMRDFKASMMRQH